MFMLRSMLPDCSFFEKAVFLEGEGDWKAEEKLILYPEVTPIVSLIDILTGNFKIISYINRCLDRKL